jgi:hypothetical protein
MRQRWAELLKRIFEEGPLQCERCGGQMRIMAFVIDPEVIGAILRHLRRTGTGSQFNSAIASLPTV